MAKTEFSFLYKFYETYNSNYINADLPKSKIKKFDKFRNQLVIDFYNLGKTEEEIKDFAAKYIPWHDKSVFIDKEIDSADFNMHELLLERPIFKQIVDKVLINEQLTDEELKVINTFYYGNIIQEKRGDQWILGGFSSHRHWAIMRVCYEFVMRLSNQGIRITRCHSPKCDKLILQRSGGSDQLYCNMACKQRAYRRRIVKKKLIH